MISSVPFQVTEYEQVGIPGQLFTLPKEMRLRQYYQSGEMRPRDASRFAAALSYARGTYVSAAPADPTKETYSEWWFAGSLWRADNVPPIIRETLVCADSNQSGLR
ncbi:MAG TPA: hypothetical protein VNH65_18950 [Candidatus Acidoferrum sp.]|nr:hypothetical protein [Candidatus Acidoferrum sp.]